MSPRAPPRRVTVNWHDTPRNVRRVIGLVILTVALLAGVAVWRAAVTVPPWRETDGLGDERYAARLRHPSTGYRPSAGHVRLVERPRRPYDQDRDA